MAEHRDGQSTAAWTAVAIVLLATLLIAVAVVIPSWPMAIVGIVLVVVGGAAGKILAMAGFGQAKPDQLPKSTQAR
jgi:protein-S-isoprenylcysteine O-methyltransferase Ste14